jgi:hypothetical protein
VGRKLFRTVGRCGCLGHVQLVELHDIMSVPMGDLCNPVAGAFFDRTVVCIGSISSLHAIPLAWRYVW